MTARRHFSLELLEARIAPALTPFLNFADLNGRNGFALPGEFGGDAAGASVSGAGDVNGDGLDDFIIGAPLAGADSGGPDLGVSYVVFGSATGFPRVFDPTSLNGSNGFKLNGESARDHAGSVSAAGDVNGDGFADLLIGAEGVDAAGADSGAAYVVLGRAGTFPPTIELGSLDGVGGFRINAVAAGDRLGALDAVSAAGDINGDGFDDILLGAANANPLGDQTGASYLVFGKAGNFAPILELSRLDGSNGFALHGENPGDRAGVAVSGAGDINKDGLADFVIGASLADTRFRDTGASYVIFGSTAPFPAALELSSLDGRNGFQVSGAVPGDLMGAAVSGGDVNGDGASDLVLAAPHADPNGTASGAVYVLFGRAGNFKPEIGVAGLNGVNGFRLSGSVGTSAGADAVAVGDVNGDGFAELLISANRPTRLPGTPTGMAYLVFGRADGFLPSVNLDELGRGFGIGFRGAPAGDHTFAVSGAGDINGDGLGDVLVGSPFADPKGPDSGATYVVFGRPAVQSDARTVLFTEADGDVVTVKLSEGVLNAEDLEFTSTPEGFVLEKIDLRPVVDGLAAEGASLAPAGKLTVKVTQPGGGLGKTNVGLIDATNVNLTKVRVAGNLNSLLVGDGSEKFAVQKIVVDSWGTEQASLLGGSGASLSANGGVGKIKVLADVLNFAASIGVGQNGGVQKMTVGGSLSGSVFDVGAKFGTLRVKGAVTGTDFTVGTDFTKVTVDQEIAGSNFVVGGALQTATFKAGMKDSNFVANDAVGTVIVATNVENSILRAGTSLNNLVVGGSLIDSTVTAPGALLPENVNKAQAFKIIGVQGDVVRSTILAGYDQAGLPVNGDAGIGKLVIKGDFEASSIVAGAAAGADGFFGNADDTLIAGGNEVVAKIASITIKGTVVGSSAAADHFGIVAEEVAKLKIGGLLQGLVEGARNDLAGIPLGTSDDVRAREVG